MIPQLLISARDYLAHKFMCHNDTDLLCVLDLERLYVESTLQYGWWVRADTLEVCPVDVYLRDEWWEVHNSPATETVAYQKYGYNVSLVQHYAHRGQPLEHPTLPPLTFKLEGRVLPPVC